jgi:nitroreductase
MLRDLVIKNRSYRRFLQEKVEMKTLKDLVDLARMSASGANFQPLKYILSCEEKKNKVIAPFVNLGGNPPSEERETAYIIILCDKNIREAPGCDHGIAAQTIMLGAAEKGLGGCIVGNVERDELRQALAIPAHLDILLVLAIGKPKETAVLDPIGKDGVKGYWDENKVRHVPKRSLDEIIVGWLHLSD